MVSIRNVTWLAFLLPTALLGGALISQYGFGLYPCEMCMWQRWPHFAAIIFALFGLLFRSKSCSMPLVVAVTMAILISGLIGGFHAGVEYDWWEGFTSCTANIASGGDMLDAIMNAPLVRCDVAPWSLFGISLAGYNFLLSVGGATLILILTANGRRSADNG